MPLPSIWNYSALQASLKGNGTTPPEIYIELWWYSGGNIVTNSTNPYYLTKGSTSLLTSVGSQAKLHTLNSSWNPNTKYALEATIWVASGNTAIAFLYDTTTSSNVAGSAISTTSTTATVVRSGQFTLTPGHVYAVAFYSATSGQNAYITDASLIVFPS